MDKPLRVLIVEDSEDDCHLIVRELRRGGFQPEYLRVESSAQFEAALDSRQWDIVLSDFSLPGYSGLAVIRSLRKSERDLPCIIVSGAIGEDAAVGTIREGAYDYVMKDRLARLPLAVEQQLAEAEARRERRRMEAEVRRSNDELAALQAIAVAVSRSLDLQKVLEAALKETLRVLGAEGGAIFLSDGDDRTLRSLVQRGFPKSVLGDIESLVTGGIFSPAAESAKLVHMEKDSPDLYPKLIRRGWTTLVAVALQTQQGVKGVLVVGSRGEGVLTTESLLLADGIGRQISVAVENAKLHEQVQARTRYLETLQMINERLRSTLPLKQVLNIIAESATRSVGGVASVILIPDAEGKRLEIGALFGTALMNAAMQFTGKAVRSYYIPTDGKHPAACAFREGRFQEWSEGLGKLIVDLEPWVRRELMPLINGAIGAPSGACVPLPAGNKTVGVLVFFSARKTLSGQERMMLLGLADQGGLAVESARLFEEAQSLRAFNEGIVQSVAEAIFIQDDSGMVTFVNPAAEAMLGTPAGELVGRPWEKLVCAPAEAGQEREALLSNEVRRYETELLDCKGQAIPVIVSARPLMLEGRSAGILSACTDISDRIRTERLLQALNRAALAMARAMTHEEIFEAVARECTDLGCPCLLLLFDPQQELLRLRHLSYHERSLAAIQQATGVDPNEIVVPTAKVAEAWGRLRNRETVVIKDGQKMLKAVYPDISPGQVEELARTLGLTACIAAPLVTDSSVMGVFAVASLSLRDRDVPAIAALANQIAAAWHKNDLLLELRRNLVELKELQNQLIHAQKMEAVGRLAGGVAHDFNNQLTVIIGNAEILFEKTGRDETLRREIEEILNTAQRSARLTQQLLAFSRKQVIQPLSLNLKQVVREMERMLRRLIGEDIELSFSLAPDTGWIHADPGQLEQVIMNLVVNARDAMPQGGKLALATFNETISRTGDPRQADMPSGRCVVLAISDNGAGMDAQTLEHLFEPFFTTKPSGIGTGLGLAIVYGIVRQSGGSIVVDSAPGKGSTFTIYLPRIEKPAAEAPEREQVETRLGGGETILLVEDEESVNRLLKTSLENSGYKVLTAGSSDEAIEIAERGREPLHLLLTDVVMPGTVQRKDMVERLVALYPDLRIILMSGYTDETILRQGVVQPGRKFLSKPFSMGRLLEVVRATLDMR